jgi:hypothetical protein
MLLLQLKFNVHLPNIMEGSSVSFSPSQCLSHTTDSLTSSIFTFCFAGASLGDSCNYEQANLH